MFYPEGSTSVVAQIVETRHRGPCGKVSYGSFAAANREIKSLKRSGKDRKYQGYLHSYACRECRAIHVGHTSYED